MLKIAFELHDQDTSCCMKLMCPGEGSAGNKCRERPGEGSAGCMLQASSKGWRPGARELPECALATGVAARGAGTWRWARV
jgi:hypothetical protein